MHADEQGGLTRTGYVVVTSVLLAVAFPLYGGLSYGLLSAVSLVIGILALFRGMPRVQDEGTKEERRDRREKEMEAYEDGLA